MLTHIRGTRAKGGMPPVVKMQHLKTVFTDKFRESGCKNVLLSKEMKNKRVEY